MKKSILAIAVAATMAAPAVVMAAPTLYGNVHISLNAADNDVEGADNNLNVSSNTSAIGVKGSEDLGDGLKAIYKLEWGVGIGQKPSLFPDNSFSDNGTAGGLTGRDQFVGLKGGWGTVKLGTMSSNYKQMGGKVDPLYRTPLEGRGFLATQSSALHGGKGVNRGRQTNTLQYVSPKMAGIQLVANTTFSGSNDETSGVGLRWSSKAFLVYADWIDGQTGTAQLCESGVACTTESAVKVGGKFATKMFSVALQWEGAEDRTGADYLFAAGTFNFNKNNAIILTAGQLSAKEDNADSTGVALAYNHKLSKMTNIYVGYGMKSNDAQLVQTTPIEGPASHNGEGDLSMFTVGLRKKF